MMITAVPILLKSRLIARRTNLRAHVVASKQLSFPRFVIATQQDRATLCLPVLSAKLPMELNFTRGVRLLQLGVNEAVAAVYRGLVPMRRTTREGPFPITTFPARPQGHETIAAPRLFFERETQWSAAIMIHALRFVLHGAPPRTLGLGRFFLRVRGFAGAAVEPEGQLKGRKTGEKNKHAACARGTRRPKTAYAHFRSGRHAFEAW
jgi:hypothetical protein